MVKRGIDRIKVFENIILRRVFEPKNVENREWRKIHNNFAPCTQYDPEDWFPRNVARMEKDRSAFKILTGMPTGKGPLERPRRRWEDNIRM